MLINRIECQMKLAACLSLVIVISGGLGAATAAEQCRFIEARAEREACYQRQETERQARQRARADQQANQVKPYEPMASDDAALASAMRGICRGC